MRYEKVVDEMDVQYEAWQGHWGCDRGTRRAGQGGDRVFDVTSGAKPLMMNFIDEI